MHTGVWKSHRLKKYNSVYFLISKCVVKPRYYSIHIWNIKSSPQYLLCTCELCVLYTFSIQKVLQIFFLIIYTYEFQISRNIRCRMLIYTDDDRVHLNECPSVRSQTWSFNYRNLIVSIVKYRSFRSLNRYLWRLHEIETISSWTLNNTVNQSVVRTCIISSLNLNPFLKEN